jgi:glucose-6-phosphate 1-dehydrogenase
MIQPREHILVIFGASGDLTKRKLLPALFELEQQNLLPERYAVLGVGRTEFDDNTFREKMAKGLGEKENVLEAEKTITKDFLGRLHYISLNTKSQEDYPKLKNRLNQLCSELNIEANYIFYLATPPSMYALIAQFLAALNLNHQEKGSWRRIIIEKPFGYNLKSAKKLNTNILQCFDEDQIYRIDHYLGKETVQNVMVTRFSNGIFEPLWNRNYIDYVEITSAESIGVEGRGGYYENSGALRDMLQNHLLQLTAIIAMEPPAVNSPTAIRNETLKVFQSLKPLDDNSLQKNVIRGQYLASAFRGKKYSGYREEEGVDPDSRTETYVALKLFIENWRWGGVPFYIRTGKRLPTRVTEAVIHFKPTPHTLFCSQDLSQPQNNQLIIRIQPDEGILLKFGMKVPGAGYRVQEVNMDFHYSDLGDVKIPEAYARLLLDCMHGDATLYARGDAVKEAWKFVDPILHYWESNPDIPLHGYPGGTWGPDIADELIEGKNLSWRYPCKNLTDDGNYCEL